MTTILIAYIDAKYSVGFTSLYLGAVFVDFCMWSALSNIFGRSI